MTTTTLAPLDELINDTLTQPNAVAWKVYAKGPFGKAVFFRFGTPPTYTRAQVREIAIRLAERHELRPSVYRIRRDDHTKGPWVNIAWFWSSKPAGEHYGIEEDERAISESTRGQR